MHIILIHSGIELKELRRRQVHLPALAQIFRKHITVLCRYDWSQRWSDNVDSLVSGTERGSRMHLFSTSCRLLVLVSLKHMTSYQLHRSVVGVVGEVWTRTYRCWPPTCQSFCLVCTQWSRLLSSAQQSGQSWSNKCRHLEFMNHTFGYSLWHYGYSWSPQDAACWSVWCVYLLTDTSAAIDTHHPQSQRFGELLALLGDLQSQLSGRSHDHSCNRRRQGRMWCVNGWMRDLCEALWGTVKVLESAW